MNVKNFLQRLDQYPPCLIRILARDPNRRRRPFTYRKIAERSGFSFQKVIAISKLKSWKTVDVGDVEIFIIACGIRPDQLWRQREFLSRTFREGARSPLSHLDGLNSVQKRNIKKILDKL